MITIDEYKNAEKKLDELNEEHTKVKDRQVEESNKLYIKYSDLERTLIEKKRKEQDALTKKYNKKTEPINKQSEPYAKIRNQYTRIMNMMDIHKNQYSTDFTVYKFDYPRDGKGEVIRVKEGDCLCYPDRQKMLYAPLDTIKNDKYAKIQAFIVETKKPKNKFSLIIAGKTIFTKELIGLPYNYSCSCQEQGTNIMISIKDLPTEKELQEYYKRNKSKILKKEFFEQLPQIEKEYKNVLKNTDNKEWKLAYWYWKKDYYENHYSHGTETKEYQEVLRQINKIKG